MEQANNKAAPTSSRKTRDQLSRAITKLLRHTAESAGLAIRPDGYVSLEEILALDQFAGVSARLPQHHALCRAFSHLRLSLMLLFQRSPVRQFPEACRDRPPAGAC